MVAFVLYPSAYANGWAAKWYKKHGGGWNATKTEAYTADFLRSIVEEVVNKHHKGSMTKKEISARDRLAKSVKGIKAIKGKDSEKNARYRYATYVVLRKRGDKSESKSEKPGKSKSKKRNWRLVRPHETSECVGYA